MASEIAFGRRYAALTGERFLEVVGADWRVVAALAARGRDEREQQRARLDNGKRCSVALV